MSDAPVDLKPLDPARDPARWQAFVERTLSRAQAALDERRREADPWTVIASWARPLLAAAAALAALLLAANVVLRDGRSGAPAEAARWLAARSVASSNGEPSPTARELLLSVQREAAR